MTDSDGGPARARMDSDGLTPAIAAKTTTPIPGVLTEVIEDRLIRPAASAPGESAPAVPVLISIEAPPSEATAEAPMMAPAVATAETMEVVAGDWPGSLPGGPVGAAMSWVMVAAARRETGSRPAVQTTPAGRASAGQLLEPEPVPVAAATVDGGNSDQAVTPAAAVTSVDPITAIVQQVQAVISGIVEAFTQFVNQVVTVVDQFVAALVNIFVPTTPVNSAPTAISPSVGIPDSVTGAVTGTVSATDADGDTLTYTAPANTSKGGVEIDSSTGVFTYTPTVAARENAAKAGATGADTSDSFTVTVSDGKGGSVTVAVAVAISPLASNPANSVPVATTPTVGVPDAVTGVVVGKVNASDPDGDALSYSAPASTAKGIVSVNPVTGEWVYTPTTVAQKNASRPGATPEEKSDAFTVTVSDGHSASVAVQVVVPISGPAIISPTNTSPVIGNPVVGTPNPVTGVVTGRVYATDADGDVLAYGGSTITAKGSVVVAADGSFSYTPTATARHAAARIGGPADDRTDLFAVTVSDGRGGLATVPISVNVAEFNSAPVAGTPSIGAPGVLGVVTGRVSATDADGDTLAFTGSATTAKGSVAVASDGSFTYTPTLAARHGAAANWATEADRSDSFTITLSDGFGGTATTHVIVPVTPVNSVPVVGGLIVGTPDGATGVVVGSLDAADDDGDTLTFGGATSTGKGSLEIAADGSFTFTPTASARRNAHLSLSPTDASESLTVTVSDGHGGSVSTPVIVEISPAMAYQTNDIKRDPITGQVAIRSIFDESLPQAGTGIPGTMTWLVGSPAAGPSYASTSDVSTWSDLYLVGATGPATELHDPTVSYPTNTIVRNPDTNAVALRTIFAHEVPELADMAWLVLTSSQGALYVPSSSVAGWDILFVPGDPPTILGYSTNDPEPNGVVTGQVDATDPNGDTLTYSAPESTSKGYVVIDSESGAFTYAPIAAARQAAAQVGADPADQSDSFVVTVSDGYFSSETVVSVMIDPAPALQPGDIRAQPGGTWRVIYAPNVSVGGDWVGVNPANGGQWFTDAEVSGWLDVAPPTGGETSSGGPYSPGDIKVPPGSVAGAVTLFAVKSGPPLSNIHSWMVCSTVNACGGVSGDGTYGSPVPVAQWVDLRLPMTSAAPSNL